MSSLTAKKRFEQTRRDVKRLDEVNLAIMYECDDWQPPSVKAHNEQVDTTASRAIYNVDTRDPRIEALTIERIELVDRIGIALELIAAVNAGLGERYSNVLEWRYIDCLRWSQVRERGIARSTGYELINIACDWIDSVGISKLLRGEYEL